jgi:hypothetical protein
MLANPDAARRMGARGRARVLDTFDPPTMCRLLDELYSEQLGMPVPELTMVSLVALEDELADQEAARHAEDVTIVLGDAAPTPRVTRDTG